MAKTPGDKLPQTIKENISLLAKLEPLSDARLKRWRAILVALFLLGFLSASVWLVSGGWTQKTASSGCFIINTVSFAYENNLGQTGPTVVYGNFLISKETADKLPRAEPDFVQKQIINPSDLAIDLVSNKNSVASGDVLNYEISLNHLAPDRFNRIIVYVLLSDQLLVDLESLPADLDYNQADQLLLWSVEENDLGAMAAERIWTTSFSVKVK